MTSAGITLGERIGPFDARLEPELIRGYASATRDPSPRAQGGTVVPPAAIVTQIWDAQTTARLALVPEELKSPARGAVHGEHDIVLHRPIVPGEPLRIWAHGHGSRPAGRNALVTLRYVAVDSEERVVAEQWWSTVYLGTTCAQAGEAPPDHAFVDAARAHLVGEYVLDIDDDMARRYAEVSGDWSAHHFEESAARQTGFDRVFLHGLCTLGICAQAVVELAAGGDAERVKRIAVRFASPVFVGDELAVQVYDAGNAVFSFEASSAGALVITLGRAELRS